MVIVHDFGIDLLTYHQRGKGNDFPIFTKCNHCHSRGTLHRHGFYHRFGITEDQTLAIPICRIKCTSCLKTFSILPSFLIPYFQHTIHTVIARLLALIEGKKANGIRQLLAFYYKRYMKQLNWVHMVFVDWGYVVQFSGDLKEEAIKYLKMILDFGESPFFRRSRGHLSTYFMAPPFYHI
ncbi:DUF6431 domain-containing protein [Schinkia azotoformans]|uniref:DUF6431 domain-containing protein n=1 Tax=Schinkia azotoformans TaxID=1454 RepID=UPI002DBEDDBF|nr:DUF6431 domain-containing protein [Schinkia azotoformans]MEC1722553.1 DUF6431 domain-containing protein [Schinkia azotoformans]MED4415835.1 DUF6431 domain-containing protein [Schinkia azotoformans]